MVEMPTKNDVFMVLVVGLHSLRTHVFCRQLISYSDNYSRRFDSRPELLFKASDMQVFLKDLIFSSKYLST